MERDNSDKDANWQTTTWEGAVEERLRAALDSTYEERFRWLVESYELFVLQSLGGKTE